ncbi:hypothetical protein TNCV_3347881, partial [Trichonephila clavipes]
AVNGRLLEIELRGFKARSKPSHTDFQRDRRLACVTLSEWTKTAPLKRSTMPNQLAHEETAGQMDLWNRKRSPSFENKELDEMALCLRIVRRLHIVE